MDYPELSGATISERDKAFAQEFANFVNGSMCSPDQTGRELTKAHRYLQQQMFKVFLCFMKPRNTLNTCNRRCSRCSSAS